MKLGEETDESKNKKKILEKARWVSGGKLCGSEQWKTKRKGQKTGTSKPGEIFTNKTINEKKRRVPPRSSWFTERNQVAVTTSKWVDRPRTTRTLQKKKGKRRILGGRRKKGESRAYHEPTNGKL